MKFILNKKICTLVCSSLIGVISLAGCGNSIPDMTNQDSEKVGEYAALLMLKYDANHRSRLVDLSDYQEPVLVEPETTEEVIEEIEEILGEEEIVDTPEVPVTDVTEEIPVIDEVVEPTVNILPEVFLGLADGISIIYKGYSWAKSYPDDSASSSYFSLDASSGKKFLIVYYTILNQSGVDQSIDFYQTDYKFKAKIAGQPTKTALPTILSEDMSTFMGNIPNGNSRDVVLLFEEDENMDNNLNGLTISIVKGADSCDLSVE